ncbi:MAG: 3-oxoacyl-[acyl-carrier-protein] reductase [Armatimonadia bacterium]|nr:3-oxoacyl-[acyl-carrier-protein] reductase [Armatimonadia bacterium]
MPQGRVALITGASRGIGAAIALRLASDGCDVALNWLREDGRDNEAEAAAVAEQARALDVDAHCVEADVTDRDAVAAMVAEVSERLGPVDILVNNAGITRDRTLRKLAPQDWDRVIEVNLTGAFNCARAVVDGMTERGWGRIVSLSSVVALMGNFGQANYAASKAGLLGLTKSLAREVARKGVTVNAVAPGFIATEMTAAIPDDVAEQIVAQIPIGVMGEPIDVANAVAFLASEEARYITGHVLSVNGGLLM